MSQKKDLGNEIKELIIARMEPLNKDSKILLTGSRNPITVKDMLNEIRRNTKLGKRIVEVQFKMIQSLSRGEI